MTGFKSKKAAAQDKLAQPEQEPVGKFAKFTDGIWREVTDGSAGVQLYTTPPKRPWVYLTDEHIKEIVGPYALPIIGYTRKLFDQIEAKSKELNT